MTKTYSLPRELGRHSHNETFVPEELREACRRAGKGLGREDAGGFCFRSAAEMVSMWHGLDLPAWIAPYALRDARLGYLKGYEEALVGGTLSTPDVERAARARWGGKWEKKLEAALERAGS